MQDFKIKPELKEEWEKCAGQNCCDGYSFGVVQATIAAFGVLDQGKTCEEVDNRAQNALTLLALHKAKIEELRGYFPELKRLQSSMNKLRMDLSLAVSRGDLWRHSANKANAENARVNEDLQKLTEKNARFKKALEQIFFGRSCTDADVARQRLEIAREALKEKK